MARKGIILAGGAGTRLYPSTAVLSKQLLPVYDKPMIYYPLSVLMLAGIKDILVISTESDLPLYERLLGDGERWGLHFEYKVQAEPRGLAEAFILGEEFIGDDNCCLILGDNLFFGHDFQHLLQSAASQSEGARIFGYWVRDPERYGVLRFDEQDKAVEIIEKPAIPPSSYAVTGLYFYDNRVVDIARNVRPSARGELEITDVNNFYLKDGSLSVEKLGRGYAWLDTGTHSSLLDASNFVRTIEQRQNLKIGCPEEIALRTGLIDNSRFEVLLNQLGSGDYKDYLISIRDGARPHDPA